MNPFGNKKSQNSFNPMDMMQQIQKQLGNKNPKDFAIEMAKKNGAPQNVIDMMMNNDPRGLQQFMGIPQAQLDMMAKRWGMK